LKGVQVRVIAILATYNEERFIANCLENLSRHGVEVHLIDNESTDQTVAIARQYLNRGLIEIQSLPREGVFRLREQLEIKENLAASLPGDWFMHVDADEIHTTARSGQTLVQALTEVEAEGYNAVNFQEYTFTPTQEEPDHDHANYLRTMSWYYPFAPFLPHRLNAWKRQPGRVDLASTGGHKVGFPGLRMHPESLVMRHYLFLSKAHAIRKFVQQTYAPEEVKKGWFGKRATLRPEMIKLPKQAELRPFVSDDKLDASSPRKHHILFS
jgi:glycosyltransferase involved in cell wall biosynthesis